MRCRAPASCLPSRWGSGQAPARTEMSCSRGATTRRCAARPASSRMPSRCGTHAGPVEGRLARSALVTGNFFQVLGVQAALGRPLLPEDDERGAARPVIVLSHTGWRKLFAGDPDGDRPPRDDQPRPVRDRRRHARRLSGARHHSARLLGATCARRTVPR